MSAFARRADRPTIVAAVIALMQSVGVARGATEPASLAYAFKTVGNDPVVYRVSEVVNDPGRPVSTIAYVACRAKPTAGANLAIAFHAQQMSIGGGGGLSDFTPHAQLFASLDRVPALVMDRYGRPTPARQAAAGEQPLPAALGTARDVVVPQLSPDGAATWQVSRPLVMYRPSPNPFQKPLQATGTYTVDYTAGPATDGGDVVPVTFKTDVTVGGDFRAHTTGEGSFEFDVRRGLVRTLSARLVAEGTTSSGAQYSSPVALDVTVLSPDAVGKLREAARKMDAGDDAAKPAAVADAAGPARRPHAGRPAGVATESRDPAWADALDLPQGTQRTAFVGHSTGGGPFVSAGDGRRVVIGFRLKMGQWMHPMIGHVEPLYDKPDDLHPPGETIMLAKDGYAVGGLWLNGPDQADALRVIYMRRAADGTLNPKDAYVGPWFGQVTGPERVKAGGTGQPVVGIYGRQGMNTDALGVVLGSATAGPTRDPTDDPNFQGTGDPKPAKSPPADGSS